MGITKEQLVAAGCRVVVDGDKEYIIGNTEVLRQLLAADRQQQAIKQTQIVEFDNFVKELGVE
jgi:hypothetical protein